MKDVIMICDCVRHQASPSLAGEKNPLRTMNAGVYANRMKTVETVESGDR